MLQDLTKKFSLHYIIISFVYFFFLAINILYFFVPSAQLGLYEDRFLIGFSLFSLLPGIIILLDYYGKIPEEWVTAARAANSVLIILISAFSLFFIVPLLNL